MRALLNTPRGRILDRVMQAGNLQCPVTKQPTCWPFDINNIPDTPNFFFITKEVSVLNKLKKKERFERKGIYPETQYHME